MVVASRERRQGIPDGVTSHGLTGVSAQHPDSRRSDYNSNRKPNQILLTHTLIISPYKPLVERVWGYEKEGNGSHLVQVTIGRLRKKLGDDQKLIIQTRPGLGYMIENLVVIRVLSMWDEYERLV